MHTFKIGHIHLCAQFMCLYITNLMHTSSSFQVLQVWREWLTIRRHARVLFMFMKEQVNNNDQISDCEYWWLQKGLSDSMTVCTHIISMVKWDILWSTITVSLSKKSKLASIRMFPYLVMHKHWQNACENHNEQGQGWTKHRAVTATLFTPKTIAYASKGNLTSTWLV